VGRAAVGVADCGARHCVVVGAAVAASRSTARGRRLCSCGGGVAAFSLYMRDAFLYIAAAACSRSRRASAEDAARQRAIVDTA